MKTESKLNAMEGRTHYLRFIFSNVEQGKRHMDSGVVYEGTYRMVSSCLANAKYHYDEVFTAAGGKIGRMKPTDAEMRLRDRIASMMHAANILVEAEHMVAQEYVMSSTTTTIENTRDDLKRAFADLDRIVDEALESREMYRETSILSFVVTMREGHYYHG